MPHSAQPLSAFNEAQPLSPEEMTRYSRHLLLPEVGVEGQKKLKNSRVLIVGAGGLGSPLLMYLAAAGVGEIGIADFDTVDTTNLQRQVAHGTENVGLPKAFSAQQRIASLNPHVHVHLENARLTHDNALAIISRYDAVADGTDNFPSRYLLNHACALLGKPDIYGSIHRFEGQVSVFHTSRGPCYQCLFREPPPAGMTPACGEAGVLGVVPGIVGCLQASEVIKVLLGIGTPLYGRLLRLDALAMRFRELAFTKNPDCSVCGSTPTSSLPDYEALCGFSAPDAPLDAKEITARALHDRLSNGEPFHILDVRTPAEHLMGLIQGAFAMPLAEITRWATSTPPPETLIPPLSHLAATRQPVVVVCKNGVRSRLAIQTLRNAGYPHPLLNLTDGMNGWARDVDKGMVVY